MKAAVYNQYGGPNVLQVREVPKPSFKDNEIIIRIHATAVNSGDVRLRKADPFAVRFLFGLFKPRVNILGSVFSGEVESIGRDVKLFNVGDQVFGHTDMRFGAYATYLSFPENGSVAIKPPGLSHAQAAAIPFGGVTALHFLKKATLKPGQMVLVVGASGAVGSAAIQLAKSYGAEVTGVCSGPNMELVRSLDADIVIDYTKENFLQQGVKYDLIYDTVNTIPVGAVKSSLKNDGTLILGAAGMTQMIQGAWLSRTSKIRVFNGVISHSPQDINFLQQLVETGRYKPVIDRSYPLQDIASAHAYVEKGHKKGNVVITI